MPVRKYWPPAATQRRIVLRIVFKLRYAHRMPDADGKDGFQLAPACRKVIAMPATGACFQHMLHKFLQRAGQVPGYGHAYVLRPGVSHARHRQGRKAPHPGRKIPGLDLRHLPDVAGERGQRPMVKGMPLAKALQARDRNSLPGDHGKRIYRYVVHESSCFKKIMASLG